MIPMKAMELVLGDLINASSGSFPRQVQVMELSSPPHPPQETSKVLGSP